MTHAQSLEALALLVAIILCILLIAQSVAER